MADVNRVSRRAIKSSPDWMRSLLIAETDQDLIQLYQDVHGPKKPCKYKDLTRPAVPITFF